MKKVIFGSISAFLLSSPLWACPEFPKHPNMHKAAADLCMAHKNINEAIEANKEHLGGHAAEAQKLLNQAMHELEESAKFANEHAAKAK